MSFSHFVGRVVGLGAFLRPSVPSVPLCLRSFVPSFLSHFPAQRRGAQASLASGALQAAVRHNDNDTVVL